MVIYRGASDCRVGLEPSGTAKPWVQQRSVVPRPDEELSLFRFSRAFLSPGHHLEISYVYGVAML